jgi:hypothetical protein
MDLGGETLWEKVGGSIWSIHCQKSTLRYVKTITKTVVVWYGPDATFVTYNATINI